MRIEPQDQAVLDHVAARGDAIVQRAVDWSNINSGSRHAEGLARILDVLDATARAIEAAGGWIDQPAYPFPGGRRLHFTDPSGNELGVWASA